MHYKIKQMQNKAIKISAQGFILLSALSFLYVSMMGFISPQSVMDLVNVQLNNNDAISSIRGVYGGVGLSIVIILVWLMVKDFKKGLIVLCLLWGFYAASRMITGIADGSLGSFGRQWLMIESFFFVIAIVFLIVSKATFKPAKS